MTSRLWFEKARVLRGLLPIVQLANGRAVIEGLDCWREERGGKSTWQLTSSTDTPYINPSVVMLFKYSLRMDGTCEYFSHMQVFRLRRIVRLLRLTLYCHLGGHAITFTESVSTQDTMHHSSRKDEKGKTKNINMRRKLRNSYCSVSHWQTSISQVLPPHKAGVGT